MGAGVVITATGTEVGKTVYTACLTRALSRAGVHVHAVKPLASGGTGDPPVSEDAALLAAALAGPPRRPSEINWMCLRAPLTPQVAAEKEGRCVDVDAMTRFVRNAVAAHEICLIEGIGGLEVPVASGVLLSTLIRQWGYPVLMVCRDGLGCINQVVLTMRRLMDLDVSLLGVVLNQTGPQADLASLTNARMIREYMPMDVPIWHFPYLKMDRGLDVWMQEGARVLAGQGVLHAIKRLASTARCR